MKIMYSILTQALVITISVILGIWTSIVYILFDGLHIMVFRAYDNLPANHTAVQYTEAVLKAMTPAIQRVPTITIIVSIICVIYFTINNIKNHKKEA